MRKKQQEFIESEGYSLAEYVYWNHPGLIEKIMVAFNIGGCEKKIRKRKI